MNCCDPPVQWRECTSVQHTAIDVTDARCETSFGDYEMALKDFITELDLRRLFLRSQVKDLWETFRLSSTVLKLAPDQTAFVIQLELNGIHAVAADDWG